MQTDGMSDYERRAWERIQLWRQSALAEKKTTTPQAVSNAVARAKDGAATAWEHVPKHDEIAKSLYGAVQGMNKLVADAAVHSLSPQAVLKSYRKAGVEVRGLEDLGGLDLSTVDKVTPRLGLRYALSLAGEGAAAGAIAGGGTVAAGAGAVAGAGAGAVPGVAATVGILAADIGVLLTGSTRVVAHYGMYHGYDPEEPGERAFMLGVMSATLITDQAAKTAAFAELHKLVGLLARNAPWEKLGQDQFVKLMQKMFAKLGERLTKRKLGSALPVAGVVIGGGLNYRYIRDVSDNAYWLYRERFLKDKYRLYTDSEPTGEEGLPHLDILADEEPPEELGL